MPYFPYSRQSKKKAHRGAITARMVANLLHVAGVNHVITIDLHATQMQNFFQCPVDNLRAEPLLARWIKHNVEDWSEGVVVSKNPGGTKRVTSLADALKLNFGIVTTDRRRNVGSGDMLYGSQVLERFQHDRNGPRYLGGEEQDIEGEEDFLDETIHDAKENVQHYELETPPVDSPMVDYEADRSSSPAAGEFIGASHSPRPTPERRRTASGVTASARQRNTPLSPLARSTLIAETDILSRIVTAPAVTEGGEEFTDERARDVTIGRLVQGHIVDDQNFPDSPAFSAVHSVSGPRRGDSSVDGNDAGNDPLSQSILSITSSVHHNGRQTPYRDNAGDENAALGGSIDAAASSDEEEEGLQNPELETTVTLVGKVKDRPVFIVDDMIDKAGSWIAAAETVRKRGGATQVVCMATHGIFGEDLEALRDMQKCECIDKIVVTNSFPGLEDEDVKEWATKLVVMDVAPMLSEAIRRFHYGESVSRLYSQNGW
jgi:ribose-phosphate pyrophosphokinase